MQPSRHDTVFVLVDLVNPRLVLGVVNILKPLVRFWTDQMDNACPLSAGAILNEEIDSLLFTDNRDRAIAFTINEPARRTCQDDVARF